MEIVNIKNEFNKEIFGKAIPVSIALIVISLMWIFYTKDELKKEYKEEIKQSNIQVESLVSDKLKENLDRSSRIANYIIESKNEKQQGSIYDGINFLNEINGYKKLYMIDKEGYLLYKGEKLYLGDREYFKKAIEGKEYTSSPTKMKVNDKYEDFIVTSMPIKENGEVLGVLCSRIPVEDIQKKLLINNFSKDESNYKFKRYIYNENNKMILGPTKTTNINLDKELINDLEENDVNHIKQGKENMYIVKTKMKDINGWKLVSVVQNNTITQKSNQLKSIQVIIIMLINLAFFILNIYIIKNRIKNKERLIKLAFEDKVTKSNNYEKFLIDANNFINNNDKFFILTFDINKFKFVNQVFGYTLGDRILKQVSKNIKKYIEGEYIYARMNSDLFVILMKYSGNIDEVHKYTNIVIDKIASNKIYDKILISKDIRIDISVGVYIINNISESIQIMIDYADMARKRCKEDNLVKYYIFNEKLLQEKEEVIYIESDIKRALEENEFELYYQPKVCIKKEEIVGLEALIRWNHKNKTNISPAKFIPIAEENGQIKLIGKWVLEEVCKKINELKAEGYKIVPISINISRRELYQRNLIDNIQKMIRKYNIDPKYIEIEITETTALNDVEFINKKIKSIKNLGIKVSMDDFGTGNSTLSNLKLIDIDTLKIDRSFCIGIENDDKSKSVVRHIINLAKELGYSTVCEGVENIEQLNILRDFECEIVQGYYYYRPMKIENIKKIL